MRNLTVLLLIISIVIATSMGCTRADEKSPLACLSLLSSNDSFALEIAKTFEQTMHAYGYRTQILFCDNSVETQQRQISNFISSKPSLVFVHSAGDGNEFRDVFERARENGSKVVVISRSLLDFVDVQSKGNTLHKGIAKAEMAKAFIDANFKDNINSPVDVLVLERLSKTGYIMTSAGMKLLGEKFIRYFDYKSLEFQKYDTDGSIFYRAGDGSISPVEEPTGGLILDENEMAILNPLFDERIHLVSAGNKDIQTVLDGQEAIDAFIATPEGKNLNIVMSFSGDAAIGANQRIMQYNKDGKLSQEIGKIAVFGSDDTEVNRNLILQSASNESVLRGVVGYQSISWEVRSMLKMAIEGTGKQILELEVTKTGLDKDSRQIIQETGSFGFWNSFDMFERWK